MAEKEKVYGQRPRPRVAVLGGFDKEVLEAFTRMFPTIWIAPTIYNLSSIVDGIEVDLIIIGKNISVDNIPAWVKSTNVICFSKSQNVILPGPYDGDWIKHERTVTTEHFLLPEQPLNIDRRRGYDLKDTVSIRGWHSFNIKFSQGTPQEQDAKSRKIFLSSAIITDPYSNLPLAFIFMRPKINLGVAWLPNDVFDEVAWVELIVSEWSKINPDTFPNYGDWTRSEEWLTTTERDITKSIEDLENKKVQVIKDIDSEILVKSSLLADETIKINKSIRRLLTAQGDDLVGEVELYFRNLGFEVQPMDKILPVGAPKREDLRIKTISPSEDIWEGIVEVRGYARSGGTTADLSRLSRFASFYQSEKGRFPDKIIYVVNGQIELNPSQRQAPLISSPEDVKVFAEQNGLIISTIDIYKTLNILNTENSAHIKKSIVEATGRWNLQLVETYIKI